MTMAVLPADPTPQGGPKRNGQTTNSGGGEGSGGNTTATNANDDDENEEIGKRRLSTWNLYALSVSMAGAQIAWTVELGYGTPFLRQLGLSEQLTSLVWLAGPLSGLVVQPVIGAVSDSSKSRYRRRFWIITSTGVLVFATFLLAYCKPIAVFVVRPKEGEAPEWNPVDKSKIQNIAIGLAVLAFYILDFSLNALQASLRNLLLDVTPPAQLNAGNAWHGRMSHAGNIVGYGVGFLPLAELPIIRLLGADQFSRFCILSITILCITVWITCSNQDEREQKDELSDRDRKVTSFRDVLKSIWVAATTLPRPIRRVCYVQLFAYMGWFPFLFYSTLYVGQVMAAETGEEPDPELATRMGYLAMLIFSVVACIAGTLLPQLANRDMRLLAENEGEEADEELARLRETVRQWRIEAARQGKPLKLPRMPFMLRNIWTAALVLFSCITFSTFFIDKVWQAMVAISLIGVCWAIAVWVPFAIIMEFLKEINTHTTSVPKAPIKRRNHYRTFSTPPLKNLKWPDHGERQPLMRRSRSVSVPGGPEEQPVAQVAGGTVLGIHNLSIVLPQFFVALASSLIFRLADSSQPDNPNTYLGRNGVAWVLRFGGLCALFGAIFVRRVPPTRTERDMRRRLGEMELLKEQGIP